MNINRNLIRLFGTLCVMLMPALAWSVTQKEMEEARTIAAKAYIRYANDGSGYLDDINPKTMDELEAALKPKEKENIKAFKAIPVPTDYKDWNKDKLLEYWAVTAFQNKGLLEKGRGGRLRARSLINKMTIAPPQPETPAAATPASSPQPGAMAENTSAVADSTLVNQVMANDQSLLSEENEEDAEFNVDRAQNYTWVYIMILGILVAIVVALVVYAASVLKKNGREVKISSAYESPDNEEMEQLESRIADKDTEIAMLKKKIETLTRQNADLKSKLDTIASETAVRQISSPENIRKQPLEDVSASKPAMRSIFLGRANIRGIFVRADRTLNPGHSVFVLDTSDGFSGSFRVADSPAAWSLGISNPKEYLESACTAHDIENPGDATRIVTESSGTAVFEGGCWRVIRKARIRYE